MQCLGDPLQGLSEIKRVLKPNGVYLACENLDSLPQREFAQSFSQISAKWQSPSSTETISAEKTFIPFGSDMEQILKLQGATVETITVAQWQQEQSVQELFEVYQSKAFGLCWRINSEDFPQAIEELREWCQEHYQSFDAVLKNEFTFDITVARNWA
jgi:ubiquinone/menaquinone biosynthesis C-methylase UbiE